MENLNFNQESELVIKKKERSLFVAIGVAIIVVIILGIIGFIVIKPAPEMAQGQVEATSVRVSGLLPGRIEKFYVTEGQKVQAGDTLAKIHSATVDAKLAQALAMQDAADAQRQKANAGARSQVLTAAYDLWQQAKASLDIHKKTYERLESLYKQNVVPAQKRDMQPLQLKAQPAHSTKWLRKAHNAKTRWPQKPWPTLPRAPCRKWNPS